MKPSAIPVLVGLVSLALTADLSAQEPPLLAPAEPMITESGPHHRVWQRMEWAPDGAGGLEAQAHSFTELATGLNRWDEGTGAYVPAVAEFELADSGFYVARQTQHQMILAPDLAGAEAVDLLAPDGARLQWRPLGLALIDRATGKSALVAELQSCKAEWTAANEVLYASAFDSIGADVRVVLSLDGCEADVVLREQIDPELLGELGFNPLTTRVLVLTEFLDPPEATVERRLFGPASDKASGEGDDSSSAQSIASAAAGPAEEPTAVDDEVSFGHLRIGSGKAFGLDAQSGLAVPVFKSWEKIENRQFLIEGTEYMALVPLLERLPAPGQARVDAMKAKVRRTAAISPKGTEARTAALSLPKQERDGRQARADVPCFRNRQVDVPTPDRLQPWDATEAGASGRPRAYSQADTQGARPGLVWDFIIMGTSATNFCFNSDSTFYISGTVTLSGTNTFEGASVLKYTNSTSAKVVCLGPVVCNTAPYAPTVFTSKNDNTTGEIVTGSTGNPTTAYCGNPSLEVRTSGQTLHDLRFSHATVGLLFAYNSAGVNTLSHSQFVRCSTALGLYGYVAISTPQALALGNVLIHNATYALYGQYFQCTGQHLTFHQCTNLAYNALTNYTSTLNFINSLLVPLGTLYNATTNDMTGSQCLGSGSGVFQTVGAASFYLADNTYRNAGTTNINATLATELKQRTTYPPIVYSNVLVTVPASWAPQAGRDLDIPDLGYHPDPIDYAATLVVVTNGGSLTLQPGTVVGTFGTHGLRIENYGALTAEGTATAPVWIVRYNTVQEQSLAWGDNAYEPYSVLGPPHTTAGGSALPSITLRFVRGSQLGGYGFHLQTGNDWWLLSQLTMQDCQFVGGRAEYSGQGATTVELKNNLFCGVQNRFWAWPVLNAYNNLFWGGSNRLDRYSSAGTWTFRDNAFHGTGLTNVNSAVVNDHNAYIGSGQYLLPGSAGSDQVLGSFTYTNGPLLGRLYQVTTNLYDAGSRTPSAAGLYHHTVKTTPNSKEGTEAVQTVDIGFHYVGTDADGIPLDTDGDGYADYFEDRNGSGGNPDSGESNWQVSENGTTGSPGLQVYTPLE